MRLLLCISFSSGGPSFYHADSFLFFKHKTAYEMRISDWSSDVCSSDLFSAPAEEYKVNPIVAKALDLIFILHADHEQIASASTVRLAGSTGANPKIGSALCRA